MNTPFQPAPTTPTQRQRIAIVGSGISGIAAAWLLRDIHDVTLFEKDSRAGGHTCTVDVDYDGKHIPVDVGFIVFNTRNYPNLCGLFDHIGVTSEDTNMSFAMSLDGGAREWCGQSLNAVFAQRGNLVSPGFWSMLLDVLKFNRHATKDRDSGYMEGLSITEYLAKRKLSPRFRDDYLIPMAAAIWSTPETRIMDFPAKSLVNFFENHRLLEVVPPLWRTVSGGSRNYHSKLMNDLGARARIGTGVATLERPATGGVNITDTNGETSHFDHVIIATHSDQALAMLGDATGMEKAILGDIQYRPNRVVLHRDARFMPKRKKAWAAWNTLRDSNKGDDSDLTLTYWMNKLQNIDNDYPLFVTLNPTQEPDPSLVFGEWSFEHPQYDAAAFDAQARLPHIQGNRATWFAGAWTGYGFHEDGLKSGMAVARALGAPIPWQSGGPATTNVQTLAIAEAAE